MAAEALDIRMARLEGAYQQINERLGAIEQRLTSEISGFRSEVTALRNELKSDFGSVRSEISDLRKQTATQFYWLLTVVLGSILVPLLRDVVR